MVLAFLSSLAVSALVVPLAGRLARRIGLVAQPRADRWHRSPTPLLGGLAILIAALVPLLTLPVPSVSLVTLIVCVCGAFALGLLDDFRHLSPSAKLVGQVLIATGLVLGGVHVEVVTFPPLAFLLTVMWVVGVMNAINLLDNMDGLAAGISAIAAVALIVASLQLNPLAALAAASTAGASLGFLAYNFHPARIFMGDAGSHVLGTLLATTALLHTVGAASDVAFALVGPLFVLAVPIFDVALVAVTRRLAGVPMSRGGKDHTSHRLAALGLSERTTVLVLYVLAATLACMGLFAESLSPLVLPLLTLGVIGLVFFGIFLSQVNVQTDVEGSRERPIDQMVSQRLRIYGRFGLEIGLDLILLTTAYYTAFAIRFEGFAYSDWSAPFATSLPVVVALQLAAFVVSGVYRTLWRYAGVTDAVLIVRATTIGTAVAALVLFLGPTPQGLSRSVFLIDWILAAMFVVGSRAVLIWLRHVLSTRARDGGRRVLIVGATDQGELALRLLQRSSSRAYRTVGFLDDDPGKRHRRLGGVPILGSTDDLAAVAVAKAIDTVVIAVPDDGLASRLRSVCDELNLESRELSLR